MDNVAAAQDGEMKIRLPKDLKARAEAAAAADGRTVSNLVRLLIKNFLDGRDRVDAADLRSRVAPSAGEPRKRARR